MLAQLAPDEVVCRKGELGNKMYIVSEGILNVETAEVRHGSTAEGDT